MANVAGVADDKPARDPRVDAAISHWAPRFVAAEVSGPCVLSVIDGGNHVVNNLWYRYRDQTADWMARQLGAV